MYKLVVRKEASTVVVKFYFSGLACDMMKRKGMLKCFSVKIFKMYEDLFILNYG